MKHKDLTTALQQQTGLQEKQVDDLLQATIETMIELLAEDKAVSVQSFGTLEVRKKNERVSVHPGTGVRMLVPPKLVLNFKQSPILKEKLKNVRL